MRFTTAELDRILPPQHLQDVQWSYGYRPSPQKALCTFLARLSWPLRLHDMMDRFGCSRSQLPTIFNDVAIFLFQRFRNKLFSDRRRLTATNGIICQGHNATERRRSSMGLD